MRNKATVLAVALAIVLTSPVEAHAATCTFSQKFAITNAFSAVTNAQRQLDTAQTFLRMQQGTVNSVQSKVQYWQTRVTTLSSKLSGLYAKEAKANRVQLIDLHIAERNTKADLDYASGQLKSSLNDLSTEQGWLNMKQRNVDDAQNKVSQAQTALSRAQSVCTP